MTVQYVIGNIFENAWGAQAYAHGCNCQGVMGAGIANSFRLHYPYMFQEYRRLCVCHEFRPGDVFFWREQGDTHVFNLATQERPGTHATYPAISATLIRMWELAGTEGITSIAIPHIGCGLGGLQWEGVRRLVNAVFSEWEGTLYAYTPE